MQTDLFQKMEEFFRDRPELVNSPFISNFVGVKEFVWEYMHDAFEHGAKESDFPKALEISPEYMRVSDKWFSELGGARESLKQEAISELEENAIKCAAALYGYNKEDIELENTHLMINGATLPIKIDLNVKGEKDKGIKKTMYIKPYNDDRLFGLALYQLVGGIDQDYAFGFNEGIILENALEGKHEWEIREDLTKNPNYVIERVKLNLVSFFIGLQDMRALEEVRARDQYMVTQEGRIDIIDFDIMGKIYYFPEISGIKDMTSRALGITTKQYDKIYRQQERLLADRIMQERDRVSHLIGMKENARLSNEREYGAFLRESFDNVLKKYASGLNSQRSF